ncbi:FAD-binding oxidoreductase [Synechococcus sp. RSCCF101]|uniref:FAD-binding oxidoreductase n=1 Tax=Synechococcus sp. RSCCF101 TaxID=2511069 RepID=UPI00124712AE|nr:FAD-binding oxidoreductase [Synechococcus sp. RSCCF101]QEY30896.1 FAD-binding oxidoreductase [Synechococcus sp. RSCCF101]
MSAPLPPPPTAAAIEDLARALEAIPALTLLRRPAELERLSRDCHDYSPALSDLLLGCRAQLVARPGSVDAVQRLVAACAAHDVPLTVRGAGTGNYGQCVPLRGGVVLDCSRLDAVRSIDAETGVVEVEAGCVMARLEQQLAGCGRSLRLMPSTWRTASIGGFIAGGSGGIGSIRWGFLRDPGHLLGLELVTMEPDARRLRLDAAASRPINHAYGTNGVITALRLATAPAERWHELVVEVADLEAALDLSQALAGAAIELQELAVFERGVCDRLPWPAGCPPVAGARLALLVDPCGSRFLEEWLPAQGGTVILQRPEQPGSARPLRELCWNHTTLHMRAHDPGWTYLQMLLPPDPAPMLREMRARWQGQLLWHLEAVRQQGAARLAGLPLLRWSGAEALEALMQDCRSHGAVIFNPHVLTVEDGGLGVVDADQVEAKHRFDPAGLLNPGKLRGWTGPRPSS